MGKQTISSHLACITIIPSQTNFLNREMHTTLSLSFRVFSESRNIHGCKMQVLPLCRAHLPSASGSASFHAWTCSPTQSAGMECAGCWPPPADGSTRGNTCEDTCLDTSVLTLSVSSRTGGFHAVQEALIAQGVVLYFCRPGMSTLRFIILLILVNLGNVRSRSTTPAQRIDTTHSPLPSSRSSSSPPL